MGVAVGGNCIGVGLFVSESPVEQMSRNYMLSSVPGCRVVALSTF